MKYSEKDDILHFALSDEAEARSVEVAPGITAELNANDEVMALRCLVWVTA